MTTTALRRPARTSVVARHYLALLGRETAPWGICVVVVVCVWMSVHTVDWMFDQGVDFLPLMAFFPLLQWRGGGKDHEAALPWGTSTTTWSGLRVVWRGPRLPSPCRSRCGACRKPFQPARSRGQKPLGARHS